jgi:hypothetical protein
MAANTKMVEKIRTEIKALENSINKRSKINHAINMV